MSEKSWREIPIGGLIVEPGTSKKYKTGSWRSFKPIWSEDRCIQCLFCWNSCPEPSIFVKDSKVTGIDYDYCKGCGLCASVCPEKAHAIEMVPEF